MSTNISDSIFLTNLNFISSQINRYLSILILLFGTIGNILNCLALSQRKLRSNPCASFFLASSINSLITLFSGVAVRLLSGWYADLTETVNWLFLCRLVYDFEFIFISVVIPTLLMFIFGLMTIFNIRHSKLRRIRPDLGTTATVIEDLPRRKKKDRHLLFMLFMQIILLTLFSFPQASFSLYSNITRGQIQSPVINAINNFILNLFFLLTYVTNGMPFYIYTLTGGSLFRKALFNALRKLFS
ncbi:hypothetical protein I4U23_010589 [Adineta vaga]|nr:hypothetical protein I4U23_010589 [Adineta vaga]